ncbi:MAG: site-specific DNA-methyltransferase [Selenomonadaceae bacterium]|nr:site-specific DNA-methyltransferase [Selenomonadaceae bacterium]
MYQIFNEDCLEGMKKIPAGSVDMILTDPPYGLTQNFWDKPLSPLLLWERIKRLIKANGATLLFCQQPFTTELIESNRKDFKYSWVWYKRQCSGFLNAKKQPLRNCSDIAVFYSGQCTYNPIMKKGKRTLKSTGGISPNYGKFKYNPHVSEDYYPTLFLDFPLPRFKGGHPTQKPVDLLEYLIKTYTNEGETVLDATMGSGSTGVAAMNTGRKFIGFETEKNFFDIAEKRISEALALKQQELFYNGGKQND